MFESCDHMVTVAAEATVISVMHHHNVALRPILAGDMREPFDQAPWRLRFPVPADFRPHYDALHSRAANFSAEHCAPVTVRRAHPARRFAAGGGGNGVLATLEFAANSGARLKNQIGVCVRMISDQMAARGNFLHEFGTGARKFPDQEKCRKRGLAAKHFEKTRRNRRIRPIVKCESDFARGIGMPERGAKQFRRRSHRGPGGNSRGGRCAA